MEKQINKPELRFHEFVDDWQINKLGEIAEFSKGKGISKADISEDGNTECIRYGELYTHYSEVIDEIKSRTNIEVQNLVLSEANDVIIPASGETQIDIATASCVLKRGVGLGGDLNIIKTKNNGVFLSYYLNNKKKIDIANLSQGISVVHLYSSQLALLRLNIPPIQEQQKIASFLTTIDDKISQLKKKKTLLDQYKKGVMQKLYSQEIRFKNDNGKEFPDLDTKPLGELLDYEQPTKYIVESTEYDKSYKIPVLTAGKTFILGYTNETFGIFENSLPVIIFDDFTTAIKLVDFPFKVKSSAMKILHPQSNENIYFIYEAIKLIDYVVGGHERHWISKYSKLEISLPCTEEQEKISKYLNALNKKINHCNMQIEKTELWKKGLLQKMLV